MSSKSGNPKIGTLRIFCKYDFGTYHLSLALTADTQSSCRRQSEGCGAGSRSTYSTVITPSGETPLSLTCSPSRERSSSPATIKSNSTDCSLPLCDSGGRKNRTNNLINYFNCIQRVLGTIGVTAYLLKI